MQQKHLLTAAVLIATGILLFQSLGVWIKGYLDGWVEMSPWRILFLLLPPIAAFSALGTGYRHSKMQVGLTGFFLSTVLFSVWPGMITSLVILYSVTTRPFFLTSIWTTFAGGIALIPFVYIKWSFDGDMLYAGGLGYVLMLSLLSGCLLLLTSAISMTVHLIQRKVSHKRQQARQDHEDRHIKQT